MAPTVYGMTVDKGLLFALIALAVFGIYVIAKIIGHIRHSERQWTQVDKSKLKKWDDEDDWPEQGSSG